MSPAQPFKWRHFEGEIILLCVRWYLRYALSYRDLEEMMQERGLSVDHTTVYRWVQRYALVLDRRCRAHLKPTRDSYRVDSCASDTFGACGRREARGSLKPASACESLARVVPFLYP